MKIWKEFLNIRNFIIFFFLYSWAYNFLLLVNFILEKSFTYCTNVHWYFEKDNNININVLRKVMILCWATLIAVPRVGQPWFTWFRPCRDRYNDFCILILITHACWDDFKFGIFSIKETIEYTLNTFLPYCLEYYWLLQILKKDWWCCRNVSFCQIINFISTLNLTPGSHVALHTWSKLNNN